MQGPNVTAIVLGMAALLQHLEHRHRLVTSEHGQRVVHGSGVVGRFNRWLALRVTGIVGTLWCAYAFCALSFYGLPAALNGGPGAFVQWASSQLIQLVLLPIIVVAQNVQQAASDEQSRAQAETLTAVLAINRHQVEILERLDGASASGGQRTGARG